MKILKLKIIKYCVFILPFLIVSCEKDFVDTSSLPQQGSPTQQIITPQQGQNKMLDVATIEADVKSVKLNENVKVLDEEANKLMISYSLDKMEFISHESVNKIQVGDLLSSAPSTLAKYGILAKVLDKEVENGKIILQIEPGEIDDLFEEADFSYNLQNNAVGVDNAKTDFGFNFNVGGNFGADFERARDLNLQIAGRIDVSMEFNANKKFDRSDNELYTKINVSYVKDKENPDIRLRLGKSFDYKPIKNKDIGTYVVSVFGAPIVFTVAMDVGLEFEYHAGVASGLIGWDFHGNAGFEGKAIGGVKQYADIWNTITADRQIQFENSVDLSGSLKLPKVRLKVIPYKRVSSAISGDRDEAAFQAYLELYNAFNFTYHSGCLNGEAAIGIKAGFAGKLRNRVYDVGAAWEYPYLSKSEIWCGPGDNTYMGQGIFLDNVSGETEEIYTIENSSGLHMAEGFHGTEVVFKSMKDRNTNTEDHNLLYSAFPEDAAGRYLTMELAPDSKYYNPNYKILGTSSQVTNDAVFKLHATDNGRYLIEGVNGKFADLLVGVNNPNSHQKFIEFYRTYNEAKTKDDCKFQILLHPHKPGHYFIYKKDKGYLTPKGNNPSRLKLVTRSEEQEFIMLDAKEALSAANTSTSSDVFNPSNTENQSVFMQAYGFGGDQSNNYLKYDNKSKLITGNEASKGYFTVYKNSDATHSIKGANGKYLDIYSSGGFIALFNSTDRYCGDCKFSIEKVSGTQDWYNIRHPKTNKVLSYRDGGGLKFISGNAGWNERFRIVM